MAKQRKDTVPFRVLFDRILVKPIQAEEITPGGIVLPEQAKQNGNIRRGTVVATGPGRYIEHQDDLLDMTVRVGDVVRYSALDAVELLDADGFAYVVLIERDVLAVEE